jgi:uroporphyrinogen III methyltransferase/synthase
MTQDEINKAIVEKAKEGKVVCRLKGGDPFIFGRGGEEAEELAKENIRFEVVPGVSSAIAAPAYAGIPLTHRLYSSSFAVIPGYEDTTKEESAINWEKLATGVGTLVFLMAVKNIDDLSRKLIEHGRAPDTPVAVVRWGTRADQRTVISTLSEVAALVREKDIRPPAVMVIGEVVNLREKLNWFETKPLFGQRVLVTREHAEGFEVLEELGAEVVQFASIEIVPPMNWGELDRAINAICDYNWLIFTSVNGVKYFFARLFEKGTDIRELKGIRVCAIGTKTAAAVRAFGIKVDLVPDQFNAEGLIEAFVHEAAIRNPEVGNSGAELLKGMRFLLPRAETAREMFPKKVLELGGSIDTPVAYRSVKPEHHGKRLKRFLKEGRITIATFTSAATFTNFKEIMGEDADDLLRDVAIAAIGPVTAKAIEKTGLIVHIQPAEATIEAMVEEVKRWALQKL